MGVDDAEAGAEDGFGIGTIGEADAGGEVVFVVAAGAVANA